MGDTGRERGRIRSHEVTECAEAPPVPVGPIIVVRFPRAEGKASFLEDVPHDADGVDRNGKAEHGGRKEQQLDEVVRCSSDIQQAFHMKFQLRLQGCLRHQGTDGADLTQAQIESGTGQNVAVRVFDREPGHVLRQPAQPVDRPIEIDAADALQKEHAAPETLRRVLAGFCLVGTRMFGHWHSRFPFPSSGALSTAMERKLIAPIRSDNRSETA